MKFGLVFKKDNEIAEKLAVKIESYLKKKAHQILKEADYKIADYLISLGGDGTLIHTVCNFAHLKIPFIGINTGNLGFLTAVEEDDWKLALDKLIEGKFTISKRMTIEAQIEDKTNHKKQKTDFLAINEAAIKGFLRIADLEIKVNGEKFLKVLGDGVIVATQTGSTAYSLSSGGPIVDPALNCFSMTPINPVGLPIPSVILSPNDLLQIKVVKGDDVALIIDGQEHAKLKESQTVDLKRGKEDIKLIYFDKRHFILSLNAKFGLASRMVVE